jgi:radical SAM superfamily enzyme YgiQ (UPF0313 family)
VDDNITLNVRRFEELCRAIVEAGLDDLDYIVQGMTSSIANSGETLAPLMKKAGFRYVFLGIENVLDEDLAFLKANAKNARRENGRNVGNATAKAIDVLHRNGMYVVGGLILGNPGDTPESVEANLQFARERIDWPYIQHPTPYPGTPMTRELAEKGLIVNDRLEDYDGTTAVVRTEHLTAEEIEFRRWRSDRWMKVKHMPAAFAHDPSSWSPTPARCSPTPSAGRAGSRSSASSPSETSSGVTERFARRRGATSRPILPLRRALESPQMADRPGFDRP